jgi:hypothetical protein
VKVRVSTVVPGLMRSTGSRTAKVWTPAVGSYLIVWADA